VNDPGAPLLNRATSALYAVGSVIKPLYAIAYLEKFGEDDSMVDCQGYYEYRTSSGRVAGVYKDWYEPGHGLTDLRKALRVSCNVFFYQLALKLGIDEMKSWADKFRVSSITMIDLPAEAEGLFPDPSWKQRIYREIWYPGDTILCGIGQGFILMTPMQILNFFNTLANRGTCYTPHVLLGTFDPNTKVMEKVEPAVPYTVDVKPKTWDFLVKALVESSRTKMVPPRRVRRTKHSRVQGLRQPVRRERPRWVRQVKNHTLGSPVSARSASHRSL
jgi:penicillin-binding protein 2